MKVRREVMCGPADREEPGGVNKLAFAAYLDEVLPVMAQQDERIRAQMEETDVADVAGGLLRTRTRPTLNRRTASARL